MSKLLRTARFLKFEKLANANHIKHGRRVPIEIRDFLMHNGGKMSVPKLSEKVVDQFGIVLSFEAVQRWAKKGAN